MFSIKEMMQTCFVPEGIYHLNILAPKGTPEHIVDFQLKHGVYQAKIQTEHGFQQAKHLRLGDKTVSWQQLGGTPGIELFQYDMGIFPGGFLMGKCYRIDVPADEAPPSPVIGEPSE